MVSTGLRKRRDSCWIHGDVSLLRYINEFFAPFTETQQVIESSAFVYEGAADANDLVVSFTGV